MCRLCHNCYMDDLIAKIEGATDYGLLKDGGNLISLSIAGIPEAELDVAPSARINFNPKGNVI